MRRHAGVQPRTISANSSAIDAQMNCVIMVRNRVCPVHDGIVVSQLSWRLDWAAATTAVRRRSRYVAEWAWVAVRGVLTGGLCEQIQQWDRTSRRQP